MNNNKLEWRERFQKYHAAHPAPGLSVDLSRMNVDDAFFAKMEPQMKKAFAAMAALEAEAIANPDESRMAGHWVGGRTSELSAVELLPAALQGFDISNLLLGAFKCDEIARVQNVKENPSAQLCLA